MIERRLTVKEVADLARLSESTIYRAAHAGRLPHVKLGGAIRFRPADVRKWLDEGDVCRSADAAPVKVHGTKPIPDGDIVYPWDRRLRTKRS